MSTLNQIEANRLNAQSSSGPTTDAGKAVSSQNAFKSGLYSQKMIIRGEKLEDLVELQVEYYNHYQPVTPTERDLVDILVSSTWQYRRLSRIDAEMYGNTIAGFSHFDPNTIAGKAFYLTDQQHARLERMQKSLQKSITDAVRELERLRKTRPATAQPVEAKPAEPEIGFVSSTAPAAEPEVPGTPVSTPVTSEKTVQALPESSGKSPEGPRKAA